MARVDGRRLGQEKRKALSCFLDLGALINDYLDQHRFCKSSYRKLRKQLANDETVRTVYRSYFRELRHAERNRPRLGLSCREEILKETANYRETVVRISLSALAAITFDQTNGDILADHSTSQVKEARFSHLFALVMLIQICDDLLDWRRDWRADLPTFATAELFRCKKQAEGDIDFGCVRANVETAAATYLATATKQRRTFWPFVPCIYAVFLLVKLFSNLLLRGRMKRKKTIGRQKVLPVYPRG
jgi:hypothetical protein